MGLKENKKHFKDTTRLLSKASLVKKSLTSLVDKNEKKTTEPPPPAPVVTETIAEVTVPDETTSTAETPKSPSGGSRDTEVSPGKRRWEELREKLSPHSTPTSNGRGPHRTDSLEVPRSPGSSPGDARRPSNRSIVSRMSGLDYSRVSQAADIEAQKSEDERKEKAKLSGQEAAIKAAIPYLPLWLAVTCLIINILLPGVGTILSGVSVLFCGKTRLISKDDSSAGSLCLNIFVGVAQMLTVTFFLVGWFWSLTWGIYMVILAVESRRAAALHKQKEMQAKALSAMSAQVRPWSLKT